MIRTFANEFVLECEEIALERRGELDIAEWESIDPRRIAKEILAIDVVGVDHYRGLYPDEVGQLTERDAVSFNAMTVFHGTRCLIVVNPSQGSADEALSVAHEIAHIELEHERLEAPLFDEDGTRRSWRPGEEAEAEYLAREILVPRRGLRTVLTQFGGSRRQAARHYGVSPALIRQRMLETDAGTAGRSRIELPTSGAIDMSTARSAAVPPQTRPRP